MTETTEETVRTPEEIETLKLGWQRDPCWDIEHTEDFEAHYDELLAFRLAQQKIWTREATERQQREIDAMKAEYGVGDRAAKDIILAQRNLKGDKERAHNILTHLFEIAGAGRQVDASDLWSFLEYVTDAAVAQATIDILAREGEKA